VSGPRRHVWLAATTMALTTLTGCTPEQLATWIGWHNTDPAAAEEFANRPEVQAALHDPPAPSPAPAPAARDAARPSAVWDRIAWCESGGQWAHPPVTNRTGTYSGGLMIWTKAWIAYGGRQFAPQAWLATRADQITVAERILADRGWQAWDCA
jgi:hypothetical protein